MQVYCTYMYMYYGIIFWVMIEYWAQKIIIKTAHWWYSLKGRSHCFSSGQVEDEWHVWAWHLHYVHVCASGVWGCAPPGKLDQLRAFLVHFSR